MWNEPSITLLSSLPPSPAMRSLNSASYRILVRIFSLCLDEQIPAPNRHPNPSIDSDPNGNSPNLEQEAESIHGSNPNGSSIMGDELADFQIKEGATLVENTQTSARQSESTHGSNHNSRLNCDANGNSKSGNELGHYRIENAAALVENPQNSAQQSQIIYVQNPSLNCDPDRSLKLGDELGRCQVNNEKGTALAENSSQSEEELRTGKWKEEERLRAYSGINKGEAFSNSNFHVFDAVKELELDDECVDIELLDNVMADCAKLIDGDKIELYDQLNLEENNQCLNGNLEKDLDSDKSPTTEKMREQEEESQQETLCKGQVDGVDFEEGEIPNVFEDSNQHLDLMDECMDKKLEESSESKGFDKNGKPNYTNLLEVNIEENYLRKDISSTLICASYQGLKALGDDGCLKPDEKKNCSRASSADVKCALADPYILRLTEENLKNLTNVEKEVSSKTKDVNVVVRANLKPRNVHGIKSNGMLMTASDASHETVELLKPPEGSVPGERIWFHSEEEKDQQPDAASPNQFFEVDINIEEYYLRKDIYNTLICAIYQCLKALDDDGCLKPDEKQNCSWASNADVKCAFVDPYIFRLTEENLKILTNAENEVSSKTEIVEVQVKKKRGPQTEERKAKRKRAKKRKRAQKEREQGVKRLKLQPIVKPKEVKYCNFYLIGRCQQGDLCKFSHDVTPLTKSQPCKHFACNSCLKGDDCPYDHQLSNYPCHNYVSKGMCFRGDNCKFSHKLPITEGSTPTSVTRNADLLVPTKKSNFVKKLLMNRTKATISSQFVIHEPLAENFVNGPKEPMHVPNGIQFISFDKELSAVNADMQKGGELNATTSVQRSIHATKCEKNVMRSSTNACPTATSNAAKKSQVDDPSRSLQTEVSEASKILEEFLFCGTN